MYECYKESSFATFLISKTLFSILYWVLYIQKKEGLI